MLPGYDQVLRCPRCAALHRVGTLASGNTVGAVLWSDGRLVGPSLREDRCATRCPSCGEVFVRSVTAIVGKLPPDWSVARPDVRLTLVAVPTSARLEVMRLARRMFGLGIAEVKGAVDHTPWVLSGACGYLDAQHFADQAGKVGALATFGPANEGVPDPATPPEWRAAPYGHTATEPELLALAGRLLSQEDEVAVRSLAWRDGNDPYRFDAEWVSYSSRPRARENLEVLVTLLPATPEGNVLRAEGLRQLGRFADCLTLLSGLALIHGPPISTIRSLAEQSIERIAITAVAA
jgi:hypothetical protein